MSTTLQIPLLPFTFPRELQDLILLNTDFNTAIICKNEYVIKKLYNHKVHTWDYAVKNGNIGILKWLHKNNILGNDKYILNEAVENIAKYSNELVLEIVRILLDNKSFCCLNKSAINLPHTKFCCLNKTCLTDYTFSTIYCAEQSSNKKLVQLLRSYNNRCIHESGYNCGTYFKIIPLNWNNAPTNLVLDITQLTFSNL